MKEQKVHCEFCGKYFMLLGEPNVSEINGECPGCNTRSNFSVTGDLKDEVEEKHRQ